MIQDGTIIDHYRILRFVGAGGMGEVYEAAHTLMDRRVALKVLHHSDRKVFKRFERECRALLSVPRGATPELYSWGITSNGNPYLAMEFLDSPSLELMLADSPHGLLPVEELRLIAMGICQCLMSVHSVGLVHRDLKPNNVNVKQTASGFEVRLMDLGIAYSLRSENAITATDSIFGSIGYMSPEHFAPKTLNARSDLFSLGCIMYRCLTGHTPYEAESLPESMLRLQTDQKAPLPDAVPAYFKSAIAQCLSIDSQKRIPSASALLDALRNRQVVTHVLSNSMSTGPWAMLRKNSKSSIAAALVLSAGVLVLPAWMLYANQENDNQVKAINSKSWYKNDQIRALMIGLHADSLTGDRLARLVDSENYNTKTAEAILRYRLDELESSGDKWKAVDLQHHLAAYLEKHGDLQAAEQEYRDAVLNASAALTKRHERTAVLMVGLGRVQFKRNKFAEAKETLEEAGRYLLHSGTKDRPALGQLRFCLGQTYLKLGDARGAALQLADAVTLFSGIHDFNRESLALNLLMLSAHELHLADSDAFVSTAKQVLNKRSTLSKPAHALSGRDTFINDCTQYIRRGRGQSPSLVAAFNSFLMDTALDRKQNLRLRVICAKALTEVRVHLGERAGLKLVLQAVLNDVETDGKGSNTKSIQKEMPGDVAQLYHGLSSICKELGDKNQSFAACRRAYLLSRSHGDLKSKAYSAAFFGNAFTDRGKPSDADALYREAQAIAQKCLAEAQSKAQADAALETLDYVTLVLAQSCDKLGRKERAIRLCEEERRLWERYKFRSQHAESLCQLESRCRQAAAGVRKTDE